MDYKQAILQVVKRRRTALENARLLYLDLLGRSSELYETEKELRSLIIDEAQGKKVEQGKLDELNARKEKILSSLGVSNSDLYPSPECKLCNDTGLVDGKPCPCIIRKCASDALENDVSFDKSDLSVFPSSERMRIEQVYKTALTFCDKFPFTNKLNLLFMGGCGSGKTFIASCIASKIAQKGYGVLMLSAFSFVNRMHKYHTTFDETKLEYLDPLLDCDLLVIDDLGTETMMKNVTVEYLFHVVNERMLLKKHTIFTTNLDDEMLLARYGERTYSRLFGSKQSYGAALSNSDLRK